jgi:glutamate/tyrosine decarboxylase-like PLP-dependent enzyme
MDEPDWSGPLGEAHEQALAYLTDLPDRAVGSRASADDLRGTLGGPLPEEPLEPRELIAALARAADPGLVSSQSGRFFGFVFGGSTPAALAADWLTSAWDQNAVLHAASPAAGVVEEVVGRWLTELFGLPADASFAFVTGVQMANFTGLAAARHEVLRRAGWDVEAAGLMGAPRVRVLSGQGNHYSIDRAVRFLGVGTEAIVPIGMDDEGRMRPDEFRQELERVDGPTIVCTQVGNVNGGAIDPVGEICEISHGRGAWVHVDGAFGLWAAVSPRLRPLLAGVELADSWASDTHKWLNVPYDSGLFFCAHREAHRAAMSVRADYLVHAPGGNRDEMDWTPESSRRARGFPVYAAIRTLGRSGIVDIVERSCSLAQRFANRLAAADGVQVFKAPMLNQVLVRFLAADGDHDGHTRRTVERVQQDGTCWVNGTTWKGQAAMRISVSNWSTDETDVDRSVESILRCAADE